MPNSSARALRPGRSTATYGRGGAVGSDEVHGAGVGDERDRPAHERGEDRPAAPVRRRGVHSPRRGGSSGARPRARPRAAGRARAPRSCASRSSGGTRSRRRRTGAAASHAKPSAPIDLAVGEQRDRRAGVLCGMDLLARVCGDDLLARRHRTRAAPRVTAAVSADRAVELRSSHPVDPDGPRAPCRRRLGGCRSCGSSSNTAPHDASTAARPCCGERRCHGGAVARVGERGGERGQRAQPDRRDGPTRHARAPPARKRAARRHADPTRVINATMRRRSSSSTRCGWSKPRCSTAATSSAPGSER